MALRNQPYLPLYVQDYLTDEKLNECSAATQGVFIKIMCVMHKSEEYGTILLKQKDKQNESRCLNFACKLSRHIGFSVETIENALNELLQEGVVRIDGDKLLQKRMIRDNHISIERSKAGKKGVFAKAKGSAKGLAKGSANPEYENEDENENENINESESVFKRFKKVYSDKWSAVSPETQRALKKDTYKNVKNVKKEKEIDKEKEKKSIPPSVSDVEKYCVDRKNGISAQQFVDFYEARGWMIGKNKMKNWQAAVRTWEARRKETQNEKYESSPYRSVN